MKIRNGFISNSSSSSFIIARSALTPLQIILIKEHKLIAQQLGLDYADQPWMVKESDIYIEGWTVMDNFDIGEYFSIIGIAAEAIRWERLG